MEEPRVPCPTRSRPRVTRVETEWPRMTIDTLKDCNKKVLARMAKDQGIVGWHAMRKDQLIRALTPQASAALKKDGAKPAPEKAMAVAQAKRPVPAPARILPVPPPRALEHACVKDRIIVMVRDPYWLHAH